MQLLLDYILTLLNNLLINEMLLCSRWIIITS